MLFWKGHPRQGCALTCKRQLAPAHRPTGYLSQASACKALSDVLTAACEQAIARSHRIGQTREVRVFHMEAVADSPSQYGQVLSPQPALKSLS